MRVEVCVPIVSVMNDRSYNNIGRFIGVPLGIVLIGPCPKHSMTHAFLCHMRI